MKILGLFILTLAMLYNNKVIAYPLDSTESVFFQSYEKRLHEVKINKVRPLRDIKENVDNYINLLSLFNEFKKYDIELAAELLKKVQNNNTFSGDELYKIKKTFGLFENINNKIIEFGDLYQYKKIPMSETFAKADVKNPMLKAHLIRLSSYLIVLDHIREIHSLLFAQDGSLRRIIKSTIDDQKSGSLKDAVELIKKVSEVVEDKKFIQQVILVRSIELELKEIFKNDDKVLILLSEIMDSQTSQYISSGQTKFEITTFHLVDSIVGFFNKLTNTLSEVFGNIAGSVSWRKGYMYNSESALEMFKADLQPMDLLLEKSPFILTDKFIPGHFGHAALYLGTRQQLEQIGMWMHPDIVEYHNEIESGKVILEAVRSGVRLTTLEDFLNIDEVTVVRKEDALTNPDQLNEQIRRGMDQIGKAYDFNFDISTLDKIVCSELLYIVYGNVNWPTRYRIGRATITPDDLAEIIFQKNSRFKVKNYLLSTERHRIELATTNTLATKFDYEMRAENGGEISDPRDPANSYWKKETKCYNVSQAFNSSEESISQSEQTKTCRTTYKEFYYEEWGL